MLKKIALLFLLWRGVVFVPLLFGHLFLNMRTGYEYALLYNFTQKSNPINHFLMYPWGNFDGIYYLLIAAKGYTVNAGFFPLFPLTIRLVSDIFGTLLAFDPLQYLSANVLVNTYFLLGLCMFYKLLQLDYSDKISFRTLIVMLCFPVSFYFVGIYTEGLFLLLALTSFYFARKQMWFWACIWAMLLTATRIVGVSIIPALLLEFYLTHRKNKHSVTLMIQKGWPLLLTPLGLLGYMWFNALKWGNALFFIQAQGNFQNNRTVSSLVFIPQTLFRYLKIFYTLPTSQYEWWVALLEFASFLLASALLYIAWKQKVRLSYIVYALLVLLIPASTGTFTGLPRYVLVLFPIYIALAFTLKKPVLLYGYIVLGLVLQGLMLALFSQGYYVS